MARDPSVDAYIAKAQPFARPILEHLRDLAHAVLPEAEEVIKWSMPHFAVDGKIVAGMAAFKAHCAFMIHGEGRQGERDAMGQFGRIETLADLPADAELTVKLREARERIATTGTALRKSAPKQPKPEIAMPDEFAMALAHTPAAQAHYGAFSNSAKREYLEWITEAKTAATRARRIDQAVAWIAEGKKRNWKYAKC
ncbi:MAG: YdeI/OmpD-associated family protein [Novosphingobium sp.]|nr:YdeI/OmpD-associated family protein [Novosphingobium sp.]